MKVLSSRAGKVIFQVVLTLINGEEGKPMEKVIAQASKWKVMLKGKTIEVELYDLVYSEREVFSILDAYKKAVDICHWEIQRFGKKN